MAQARPLPRQRTVEGHGFAANMHLAQSPVRPRARRQAILQKQLPVGGRQVGQGDALLDDLPIQLGTVPQLRATQHHRGTEGQGRVQLLDEAVKIQGGELQYPVLRDQLRIVGGNPGELTQRTMADGNALGFAGGARGVDHIGQAARFENRRWIVFITHRQLRLGEVDFHGCHVRRQWQAIAQVRLGQHQAHIAVLEHVHQTLARVLRVQRHIGRAGLEHRQQADHHGEGALHGDPDQGLRADASGDQVVRQAVGLAVQFTVAEGLIVQGQRLAFGLRGGLVFEQSVHAVQLTGAGRGVPVLEHALLLGGIQQRKLGQTAARGADDRLQQLLPVLRQAFDGRCVEQIGGVVQRRPKPFGRLVGIQAQVEMRGLAVPIQLHHAQARQLLAVAPALGIGLMVEHHLEQRVVAQAAFRRKRHHQLLERQVLVGLGFQGAALGLLQQLDKAHLPVQVSLEHLGVDEKPDQPLGFDAVAVGNRHADADIRLPAVAVQQGLEGREQQHERGDALLLRQALEAGDQFGLQVHLQARAAMTLLRRARTVQRQFQHRLFTAQQRLPIGQLPRPLPRFHPAALPQGVVGVLDRQLRQLQVLALAAGGIQLHQLLNHHLH
ncbi:hypothetical protein [Pseudomonas sp. 37 R 15]|nr:hypothetical protein [Pseudomonas sp. 37 R 15]